MKLTSRVITDLPLPTEGKEALVWDDTMPGFGVRVTRAGAKAYILQYTRANRRVRETLGRCDVLTLTDAKAQAKRLLAGALLAKNDPTPVAMTVKAAIDKFETLHLASRSDAYRRSWATMKKRHLPAKLLASDLNSVTRRDWIALSDPLTRAGKKGMARFVSSTVRAFLSFCVDRGYLDAHPLAGVRRVAPPPPRTRVLSELELQVIWQAANSLSRVDALAVKALMIIACRRPEILELTCSEYDVGKGVMALNGYVAQIG